jgi:hypothetical protein
MGNASMLNGWRQFALLSITFTGMLITARIFSKSEAKNEGQGKTQISSGSKVLSSRNRLLASMKIARGL